MTPDIYPDLNDDDHVKCLGDAEWQRVGDLRAAATKEFEPPPAYEHGLKKLRVAASTPESTFEESYKTERMRALEATRAALDAEEPQPRLTDMELEPYRASDPYAAGIKALQAANQRRVAAKERCRTKGGS